MGSGSTSWDRRIHRAERLAAENEPAAPLLVFYLHLLRQQKSLYDSFDSQRPTGCVRDDLHLIAEKAPALLHVIAEHGPAQLVAEARALLESGTSQRQDLLLTYWNARSDRLFFAKALLQPYGQWLADGGAPPIVEAGARAANRCPHCGGAPQVSMLEADSSLSADGSTRRLLCATCLTTWPFRRVVCPSCGEEDERKMGYFHSAALDHVRVDACERCGRYLKTIDLSRLGLAVPLVDEVAGAPLDIWAREHGYEKIELNLVGL